MPGRPPRGGRPGTVSAPSELAVTDQTYTSEMDPQWRRRLLVVEDEPLVARLLRGALESLGFDVATAASNGEARAALADFDPDVVLIDLMLGDGPSGADLAHVVHHQHPGVGILILTRFPDLRSAGLADDALPPGAGFVRKDMVEDPSYIVTAIDEVVAGKATCPRQDHDSERPLAGLTKAQHEVLRMVAQGYDNSAIATHRGSTLSTVENTIAELYRRLGIDPHSDLNPRVEAARRFVEAAGLPARE